MKRVVSLVLGLAAGLGACTTTNPPYDAGEDAVSPDVLPPCDPTECRSGRCLNDGRCATPCTDSMDCAPNERCCRGTFCTDLDRDPQNCGACETACGSRQVCSKGACTDVAL